MIRRPTENLKTSHASGDTSDPALPRISRRQLRNVAICARSADVAALAVLLGRRLNSKPASRPVLEQRFELHVACRDLPGGLASREDGKELAEAMTLELKLETHARARLPQRLDGHRANRAHRAIGAAKGRLAWGLMLGDLVGDVPCPARNLASLKHSRPDARRPVRLDLDAHQRVLP